EEQAAFVAQRVLELRDDGVPLKEQAVLYRAHAHSLELQLELARRNIPYIVRSGVRFFEQAHVKDVVAHSRPVHTRQDALAFVRMARLYAGIGQATATKLQEAVAQQPTSSLPEALRSADAQQAVARRGQAGLLKLLEVVERLAAPGAEAAP